ncbi:MAG: hypothetical protein HYV60_04325, partial [Planctomycetia bacterium]|nr:hypothetical protein [Planctomycetia bacterium]
MLGTTESASLEWNEFMDRREFLSRAGTLAGLASLPNPLTFAREPQSLLPVAAVVTSYAENSHADVILGKILNGFDQQGGSGPDLKLVSL